MQLKKTYNNLSIKTKLIINFTISILIIVTMFFTINSQNVISEIARILDEKSIQDISQTKNSVNLYIKNLENIAFYISRDQSVQEYNDYGYNKNTIHQIKKSLETYSISHPQIGGILIAFTNGDYISNDMMTLSSDPITQDEWFKQSLRDPSRIHVIAKPMNRNVKSIYDYYSPDTMLSLVKAITNKAGDIIGVVLIDLKLDGIGNIIEQKVSDDDFFYMVDENFNIIYSPVNPIVYRIKQNQFSTSKNGKSFYQDIQGERFKVVYTYSRYLKSYIVGVYSLEPTNTFIVSLQKKVSAYSLLLVGFGILSISVFTVSITKPIRKMQKLMGKIEDGNLDVYFDVESEDEIGNLGRGFNQMVGSIKKLVEMVKQEQQKKKEAELKAFQAQIKPHFLYNTLDTINWMAQSYDADDISDIVCNLTSLFRISLSRGKEIIALKDEVEQVISYLKIQMVRYRDKFDYTLDISKNCGDYQVVKLILQPFVENALYHGIKPMREFGYIEIAAKEREKMLVLTVSDNGVGIDSNTVSALNEQLRQGKNDDATTGMGIGIFNVNERIKLNYGNDYGVIIASQIGKGTQVTIRLPKVK